ncbi:hydantoinase B/oxoprolinase family protein [Cupriavidus necator]
MLPTIPGSEAFVSRAVSPDTILRTVPPSLQMHTVDQRAIDELHPLTYEVVRHRLWSITDEMGETLKRMSGSPVVSEANDYDFTINDETGQEVQIGLYNTMLAGAIDLAIYWTLQNRADNPGIEDGDMFLCNDPWIGGGLHQSDVVIFQPIFYEGKLFSWTSAICHEPDLGGVTPGSMPIVAPDVFSEALPTPPIKVVRNFTLQRDVADMWVRRSRVPQLVGLDLRAKIGANAVGRKRMLALIEQYGPDTVKAVMKRMMDDAERRLRDKLRDAPDGTWQASSYMDQSSAGDRSSHKLMLTMTKNEDHLTFDFTGTAKQAGVINCTYAGSRGGIMLALLPTLAGNIPWSAGGLMRCFDIVTQEGTMNNATFPAAINKAPIATAWSIGNLAAQCLSQMLDCSVDLKANVQATCCGTWNTAVLAGLDQRAKRHTPFVDVVMESMAGGYGARPTADGIDTGGLFCIPMGKLPDVEMTELLYPMIVLWRREEPDSGGPGRHRGGVSASAAITPHGTSLPLALVLSSSGMATAQNQGLAGGHPGNTGHNVVVRSVDLDGMFGRGELQTELHGLGGDMEIAQCMMGGELGHGDVLYLHCQGGGGYGDPLRRDPQVVAADLRAGKISSGTAELVYGVVTDLDGEANLSATEARRNVVRDERRIQSAPPPVAFTSKFNTEHARPVDDNLALVRHEGAQLVVCRHCGHQLSDHDKQLAVACRDSDPLLGSSNVRVDPNYYVDEEIVFREHFCPGCWTTLHTGLVPKDHEDVISGMKKLPAVVGA